MPGRKRTVDQRRHLTYRQETQETQRCALMGTLSSGVRQSKIDTYPEGAHQR